MRRRWQRRTGRYEMKAETGPTARMRRFRHRQRERCIAYLGGCCVRCGTTENIEFDHIEPGSKSFRISQKIQFPLKYLKSELDKCQLLCTQCHLEKGRECGERYPAATHGTFAMYTRHKCRCAICRAKMAQYARAYRAQQTEHV